MTPKHYESDTTVHRGRITKQGSRLVRWAAVEAVQRTQKGSRLAAVRDRVAARRGRNIGTVAAARELVEMIFYALRDHHVRRLARPAARRRDHQGFTIGAGRNCHDPRTGVVAPC